MAKPNPGDVTRLLMSWSDGRRSALDEMMPLLYSELRRLAAGYLRHERLDHTAHGAGTRGLHAIGGPIHRRLPYQGAVLRDCSQSDASDSGESRRASQGGQTGRR